MLPTYLELVEISRRSISSKKPVKEVEFGSIEHLEQTARQTVIALIVAFILIVGGSLLAQYLA